MLKETAVRAAQGGGHLAIRVTVEALRILSNRDREGGGAGFLPGHPHPTESSIASWFQLKILYILTVAWNFHRYLPWIFASAMSG